MEASGGKEAALESASSDGFARNRINQVESRESLRSEQALLSSNQKLDPAQRDWRHYFGGEELEMAWHKVEVEQKDVSEEGGSSASCSDSNDSGDNMDADEMYEKVYGLGQTQADKLIAERKALTQKFINNLQKGSPITAPQFWSNLRSQLAGGREDLAYGSGINAIRNAWYRGGKRAKNNNLMKTKDSDSNNSIRVESPLKSSHRCNHT